MGSYPSLIAKELRLNILSWRFLTVLILFFGLGFTATVIRTGSYQRMRADHTNGQSMREIQRQKITNIMDAFFLGYVTQRPPDRLSVFCYGLEDDLTRVLQTTLHHGDRVFPRRHQNLFFRINYPLDLVTIITILGSLLALLLVFDSLSRERESGTMAVLLCGPLPRHSIILGKLIAGSLTLLIPFAITWLSSIVWVIFAGHIRFTGHELIRLMLIIACSGMYLLVFFSIGMACSALCKKSATSLSLCLIVWTVFVLAGPSLLPSATGMLIKGPSRMDMARMMKEKQEQFIKEQGTSVYARYSVQSSDMLTNTFEAVQDLDRNIDNNNRALGHVYRTVLNQQANRVLALLSLSPAIAYSYLSADISGTGVFSYNEYMAQFDRYALDWQDQQWAWAEGEKNAMPPLFHSALPGIRQTVQNCSFGIVSLAIWAILFCMIAVMGFIGNRSPVGG